MSHQSYRTPALPQLDVAQEAANTFAQVARRVGGENKQRWIANISSNERDHNMPAAQHQDVEECAKRPRTRDTKRCDAVIRGLEAQRAAVRHETRQHGDDDGAASLQTRYRHNEGGAASHETRHPYDNEGAASHATRHHGGDDARQQERQLRRLTSQEVSTPTLLVKTTSPLVSLPRSGRTTALRQG